MTRPLMVLALALFACGGHRSIGSGLPGDRSPYIWRGAQDDAAIDIATAAAQTAIEVANHHEPDAALCTQETENGDPPHACPARAPQPHAPEDRR